MTLGFSCLAILGFIIGGTLRQLKSVFPLFVILYGIFNASGEMGPGSTVFLVSSEPFPTPLRGHFLGVAAAMGKVGAVVGKSLNWTCRTALMHRQRHTSLQPNHRFISNGGKGSASSVSYRISLRCGRCHLCLDFAPRHGYGARDRFGQV